MSRSSSSDLPLGIAYWVIVVSLLVLGFVSTFSIGRAFWLVAVAMIVLSWQTAYAAPAMFGLRLSEILIILVLTAPTIWALIDMLGIPTDIWAASKQSQGLWVVLGVLVPVLVPVLYFFIARPRLQAAQ